MNMNEPVDRRTRAYREQAAATPYNPGISNAANSMSNMNATTAPATDLPQRPARKPFGSMSLKLDYPQREGFHRHWFNDIPGRIGRAQEAGYEHIKDRDGKPVSRIVGSAEGGGALTAFLMEIPEEWYRQDMAQEQQIIHDKESAMKRGVSEGQEGEGQYVPKQGISIRQG
jgi:hypothetical protein